MAKTVKRVRQPLTKGVAKVPVVMQMEALECGAASLTMILAYYEKWIPLNRFVRTVVFPGMDPMRRTFFAQPEVMALLPRATGLSRRH